MITTSIPYATNAQLPGHINIPLVRPLRRPRQPLQHAPIRRIVLPRRTTINTFHLLSACLRSRPLLKTLAMDVVSAGRAAPDDVFAGLEFHDAHGTVAFDGLAVAGVVAVRGGGGEGCGLGGCGGGGEDFGEFGSEEGELVGEVGGGFEDVDKDLEIIQISSESAVNDARMTVQLGVRLGISRVWEEGLT